MSAPPLRPAVSPIFQLLKLLPSLLGARQLNRRGGISSLSGLGREGVLLLFFGFGDEGEGFTGFFRFEGLVVGGVEVGQGFFVLSMAGGGVR